LEFEEKDNVNFSFSIQNKPVAELSPGEILVVETADSFNGQVLESGQSLADIDWNRIGPVTGPFYINGAEPGDALEIEILEIKAAQQGIMAAGPDRGILPEVDAGAAKILKLSGNSLILAEGLSVPTQPMIGIIGVAPEKGEISTRLPGPHGGKLNTREISPGSKVCLPVFQAGAFLALGDVHLLLGDGVVSGCGIGASAEVKFRVELIKGMKLTGPQVVTEAGIYFLASAATLPEAIESACKAGINYIAQTTGLPLAEAYMAAGAVGQLGFCQAASSPYSVKFFVPRLLKLLQGE